MNTQNTIAILDFDATLVRFVAEAQEQINEHFAKRSPLSAAALDTGSLPGLGASLSR